MGGAIRTFQSFWVCWCFSHNQMYITWRELENSLKTERNTNSDAFRSLVSNSSTAAWLLSNGCVLRLQGSYCGVMRFKMFRFAVLPSTLWHMHSHFVWLELLLSSQTPRLFMALIKDVFFWESPTEVFIKTSNFSWGTAQLSGSGSPFIHPSSCQISISTPEDFTNIDATFLIIRFPETGRRDRPVPAADRDI